MDSDFEIAEPPSVIPNIVAINKWDGEDEEENVKDNWEDDEDDKKKEEQPKKQQSSAQSKKPKSRLEEKIEERERREKERRAKSKLELNEDFDETNMTPEQIQAEKLRRQKLIEEADFEVAKEMLGISDEESVDKLNPKTKEDFVALKDALCRKILSYKKSEHFNTFIEELFRDLSASCSATELKKIKLNLDNIFNEKVKIEKSEKGKKSKAKSKAKLRVEGDMLYDEYSAYTIDDYDDFM